MSANPGDRQAITFSVWRQERFSVASVVVPAGLISASLAATRFNWGEAQARREVRGASFGETVRFLRISKTPLGLPREVYARRAGMERPARPSQC
jgi:hypothetical protein